MLRVLAIVVYIALFSFTRNLVTHTTTRNLDVFKKADIIFLCVKPCILAGVLDEVRISENGSEKLYVSVAAGVTLEFMQQVRTLPKVSCTLILSIHHFLCVINYQYCDVRRF